MAKNNFVEDLVSGIEQGFTAFFMFGLMLGVALCLLIGSSIYFFTKYHASIKIEKQQTIEEPAR